MTSPLTAREEIATRIACAIISSPQQADPIHRLSENELVSTSTRIANEIINESEEYFKARAAGRTV